VPLPAGRRWIVADSGSLRRGLKNRFASCQLGCADKPRVIAMTNSVRFLILMVSSLAAGFAGGSVTNGRVAAADQDAGRGSIETAADRPAIPAGHVTRQTRIFVPNAAPYDKETWAETVLGRVVAPLVAGHPELRWYWFSRYVQPVEGGDDGDTDLAKIPAGFFIQIPDSELRIHRSLRLRLCLPADKLAAFEASGRELIEAQGCAIADWREWDLVADLASGRHLGENRSPQRQARRAETVVQFYRAASALALDCLIGPDAEGSFRFERNEDPGAPLGSSFATPHHVFCNITDVPLCVLVTGDDNQISIGTFASPPPEGTRKLGQVRVRF